MLRKPEKGCCAQCGVYNTYIRKFNNSDSVTAFCQECWSDFIYDECNVIPGNWSDAILLSWRLNISLRLESEGDRGTTQDFKWN